MALADPGSVERVDPDDVGKAGGRDMSRSQCPRTELISDDQHCCFTLILARGLKMRYLDQTQPTRDYVVSDTECITWRNGRQPKLRTEAPNMVIFFLFLD